MKIWILKLEVKCSRAEGLWKTSSSDRVQYGWRTSAVLVAVQRLTLGVGVMFSFWNDLLWEQPPPAGVAVSSPGAQAASALRASLFQTLLLYLLPLLLQAAFERKAFYLFSRVRGFPLQCLTTTTLILHFKWGANVSPECFSKREVGLDAACYAGCLFSFPFT